MKDYGYYYRQLFLRQERDDQLQRKIIYGILYFALVYFSAHIVVYLMR